MNVAQISRVDKNELQKQNHLFCQMPLLISLCARTPDKLVPHKSYGLQLRYIVQHVCTECYVNNFVISNQTRYFRLPSFCSQGQTIQILKLSFGANSYVFI